MQEDVLYGYWQHLGRSGRSVRSAGHHLRVIDSGCLNQAQGPDFRGARFELDGVCYQGDVEMHRFRQDWYNHGHHLDDHYSNVVLHVVLQERRQGPGMVRHQRNEKAIPTLCLTPQGPVNRERCGLHLRKEALSGPRLQRLALERLQLKAHEFDRQIRHSGRQQVFYERLMRALGCPANGDAFQLLACRLRWPALQGEVRRLWLGPQELYALYARLAGFPQQAGSLPVRIGHLLEQLDLPGQDGISWACGAVRPFNHPHFRLAAWVALLLKHKYAPLQMLQPLMTARQDYGRLWSGLCDFFELPCTGYWCRHCTLSRERPSGRENRRFLGRAAIAEMVINVVLPFFSALAVQSGSSGYLSYLQGFYLWLPHQQSYTSLLAHYPWLKEARRQWPGQAVYQAVLYLQQGYCRHGQCAVCPLCEEKV